MFKRTPRQYLTMILAFLLGTGVGLVLAQQMGVAQSPPAPAAAPAPPPYVPPAMKDVLYGKAPLRLLVIGRQTMLAWKNAEGIRVTDIGSGDALMTTKAGEVAGIVRDETGAECWLRQNFANYCAAPGTIRLTSAGPIKVWTPTPDTWQTFAGPLVITPTPDGGFAVAREVLLEEYLRNVVPAEMPDSFHPQALRAQAIIARTYALIKLGRHAAEGADVCASEHCQVYDSAVKRAPATESAILNTRGLVLYAGWKLAEPYYSSTCGGVTDDAGLLWGPEYDRPYLSGVPDMDPARVPAARTVQSVLACTDAYCRASKSSRWTRQFTAAQLNALVAVNLPRVTGDPTAQIRTVTSLTVEERTPNGRVASLRVEGDGASIVVFGDQVRWLFGNGSPGPTGLWSTLFELTVTRDAHGALTGCTLRGGGRGHGIGLCQWGAESRARAGQTCRQILHAYYPGTRLSDEKP